MVSPRPDRPATAALILVGILLVGAVSKANAGPEAAAARPVSPGNEPAPEDRVRSSLREGNFPWYDAAGDAVRLLKLRTTPPPPAASPAAASAPWRWGDYVAFGGFVLALVVLALVVYRFWDRFESRGDLAGEVPIRVSRTAQHGEVLPPGLRGGNATDDPWAEADRRRLAGDLAGAIVCLFAHQLLTLARLGLVRLGPGRTARQLHRAVADRELQALVLPTLRQFEAVYYGHKLPAAAEFAALWADAEAFERRVAVREAG